MTAERDDRAELEVWFALRQLEERFAMLEQYRPARPGRIELWGDYLAARHELVEPMEELRSRLSRALPGTMLQPGTSAAEGVFAAVVSHCDERELAQRPVDVELPPTALYQTELCGLYDGGERFFAYLEAALRAPDTSALVLQLFLFCLRSGFCGRYAEPSAPDRMARYDELCRRVSEPSELRPVASATRTPPSRIEGMGFPYHYYLVAALAVLGFWITLNWSAGLHQSWAKGLVSCAPSE